MVGKNKKIKLIVFTLLIVVGTYLLFLNLPEKPLDERIKDYLLKKDLTITESQDINIFSQNNKNYKDFDIYEVRLENFPPLRKWSVLEKSNRIYLMSRDFNRLLNDTNQVITDKNAIIMAEKFVELSRVNEVTIQDSEFEDVDIGPINYNVQLITHESLNGIKRQWNFKIKDGQFCTVRVQTLNVFSGDFQKVENISVPPVGYVQYLSPELVNISIFDFLLKKI